MFLSILNDRGVERLYAKHTYRVGKTVKSVNDISFGRVDTLMKDMGMSRDEVIAWAQSQVDKMNSDTKSSPVSVSFSPDKLIDKDDRRSFLAGYLFLQSLYYDLKMKNIFRNISRRHMYEYDLDAICSDLIFARVLEPGSKAASYQTAERFLEPPKYERHDVYRVIMSILISPKMLI